jgi:hypothetical protein
MTIREFINTNVNKNFKVNDELSFDIHARSVEKNDILTAVNQVEKNAFF